jgi:hypothetical protein
MEIGRQCDKKSHSVGEARAQSNTDRNRFDVYVALQIVLMLEGLECRPR